MVIFDASQYYQSRIEIVDETLLLMVTADHLYGAVTGSRALTHCDNRTRNEMRLGEHSQK